jgi:mRNA-degrading endonuclease RelE of RelBE toxin-antitoxin system
MSAWQITLSKKAAKQIKALPKKPKENLYVLLRDIELHGPTRGDWPNYSKLGPGRHHCHFKKGRPTYVAIWEVRDRTIRLIEVTYAGTHEKAPY